MQNRKAAERPSTLGLLGEKLDDLRLMAWTLGATGRPLEIPCAKTIQRVGHPIEPPFALEMQETPLTGVDP